MVFKCRLSVPFLHRLVQGVPLVIIEPIDIAHGLIQDRFISHVHLRQRCITKETVNHVGAMSSLAELAFKLLVGITEQIFLRDLLMEKFDEELKVVYPHITFVDQVEKPVTLLGHVL